MPKSSTKSPAAKSAPDTTRRLSGFDSFVAAGARSSVFSFELEGEKFEVELHPLTLKAYQTAEALIDSVEPPLRDPKDPYSMDANDPAYRAALVAANSQRRVILIEASTGWHIPGETLAEKAAAVESIMRPDMAGLLLNEIERRYTSRIEATANFTFGEPSPESPPSETGSPSPTA